MRKLLISLLLLLSSTLPLAAQKIDLATKVRGKLPAANLPDYVTTKTGPQIDPYAYGAARNGSADDSAFWVNALAQQQASSGSIICSGPYKLDRVPITSNTWIEGTNSSNAHGCRVFTKTDAAFIPSGSPTSFLGSVTFKNIQFVGGVNPIDLPYINESDFENLAFFNVTGCGISLVFGEQRIMRKIISTHTGNNGFAVLCTGDRTKSLFSASLTPGFGGADRMIVEQLVEQGNINAGTGNYNQWLWWHFNGGVDDSRISNLICFFSCVTGVWQLGDNTGQTVLFNSLVDTVDLDHVGLSAASPAGTLFNIQGSLDQSLITNYDPDHNTNYFGTQMFVDACNDATLMNMRFSGSAHGVDNATKFGLKFGNHGGTRCNLIGISGGLFTTSANNFKNMVGMLNGAFEPSNFNAGGQVIDQQNTGIQLVLANNSVSNNGSPATSCARIVRGVGDGSTWTNDFTSCQNLFTFNNPFASPASTKALATASIGANTCAAAQTVTMTGALTGSVVKWSYASTPIGVTGYGTGGLQISTFATTDTGNVVVCNITASPITPGAISVNLRLEK